MSLLVSFLSCDRLSGFAPFGTVTDIPSLDYGVWTGSVTSIEQTHHWDDYPASAGAVAGDTEEAISQTTKASFWRPNALSARVALSPRNSWTVSARVKWPTNGPSNLGYPTGSATHTVFSLYRGQSLGAPAEAFQSRLWLDSQGKLSFAITGSPIATSATSLISPDIWYDIELSTIVKNSGGKFKVRVNGKDVVWSNGVDYAVTSVDTAATSSDGADRVYFGYLGGVSPVQTPAYFDDLIVRMGDTPTTDALELFTDKNHNPRIALIKLDPATGANNAGVGTYSQLSRGGQNPAPTNVGCVAFDAGSGTNPNGQFVLNPPGSGPNDRYVYARAPYTTTRRDSYKFATDTTVSGVNFRSKLPKGASSIEAVRLNMYWRTVNSFSAQVYPFIRLNGIDYQTSEGQHSLSKPWLFSSQPSSGYVTNTRTLLSNPNTLLPWKLEDLSGNIEVGVLAEAESTTTTPSPEARISNYTVELLYNASTVGDPWHSSGTITSVATVDWFDQGVFGTIVPSIGPTSFGYPKIKSDPTLLATTQRIVRVVDATLTAQIDSIAQVSSNFQINYSVLNTIDGQIASNALLVGYPGLRDTIDGSITIPATVGGFAVYQSYKPLLREFFALRDKVRPSFPWIIHAWDVPHASQIVINGVYQMDPDKPFIVSSAYNAAQDPAILNLGGYPNWIGMVIEDDIEGPVTPCVRFRPPEYREVVFDLSSKRVMRWEGSAWVEYATMPERAINGQFVFDLLDGEDKFLKFAQILGLMLAEWQYDSEHLMRIVGIEECPESLLNLLANNYGGELAFELALGDKREFLRNFVELQRKKGTGEAVKIALRILGFQGYATQIWVNPGGGPEAYIEKPIGYDWLPPSTHFPASQVAVHISLLSGQPLYALDSTIKERVAEFLVKYALPAHVQIRKFVTDVPADFDVPIVVDETTVTII